MDRAEQLQKTLVELLRRESEQAPNVQTTVISASVAEKINRTAKNTGVRFNIVDSMGFEASSLSMLAEM